MSLKLSMSQTATTPSNSPAPPRAAPAPPGSAARSGDPGRCPAALSRRRWSTSAASSRMRSIWLSLHIAMAEKASTQCRHEIVIGLVMQVQLPTGERCRRWCRDRRTGRRAPGKPRPESAAKSGRSARRCRCCRRSSEEVVEVDEPQHQRVRGLIASMPTDDPDGPDQRHEDRQNGDQAQHRAPVFTSRRQSRPAPRRSAR